MKLCKQEILTKESINSNGLTWFFHKKVEIEKVKSGNRKKLKVEIEKNIK